MKQLIYTFALSVFLLHTSLFAQPNMVSDDFENTYDSRFSHKLAFNGQFVFTYEDSTNQNIWITDGTTITNLTENISDNNFYGLTLVNNELYFIEFIGDGYSNLWKSDGTPNGHQKVLENTRFQNLYTFQDKLYFITNTQNVYDLWVLDNDIPKKLMDDISSVFRFTEFNNELYFFSKYDGLVKTDGTVAGTVMVKPYDVDDFYEARLYQTAIYNGELYFQGCDTQHGCELWKTDGTSAGTTFVKDLNPTLGSNGKPNSSYFSLIVIDNKFYLYSYGGLLLYNNPNDIVPLLTFSSPEFRGDFYTALSINDIPIFMVETYQKNGVELWTTDGTPAGTKVLKEINKSAADGVNNSWSEFTLLNGYLYFQGNDGIFGNELWRTDGTTEGTELVYDLSPRGASSNPSNLFAVGNDLYFSNRIYDENGLLPLQLWRFPLDNFTPQRPPDYRDENEWFSSIYGGYYNEFHDFEKDKNNNVYVAIFDDDRYSIRNSVFFDHDTIIPISPDNYNNSYKITIGKISETNDFKWANTIYVNGSTSLHNNIVIAPDNEENLYVAGLFDEELSIGGTTIYGDEDGFFIAKYDKNGLFLWAKTGILEGYSECREMLVNSRGDIFLAGFTHKISYQGKVLDNNQHNSFVMKLNNNGDFQWLSNFTAFINDVDIAFTPEESVIWVTSTDFQISIHKINDNGQKIWDKQFPVNKFTTVKSVKVSPFGHIYLVGGYLNDLRLGNASVYFEGRYRNAYVAKFDAFGEHISLTADQNSYSEYLDIQFDADNNYYLIKSNRLEEKRFYEHWENYGSILTSTIQQFDPNGQKLKEREIVRTFFNRGKILLGSEGNIFYADMYSSQLDSFSNSIRRSGTVDDLTFILHFSMADKMETFEPIYTDMDFTISPNPMTNSCTIQTHNENWQNYRLNIYNSNGQFIRSIEKNDIFNTQVLRVSDLPPGILIFQFDNGQERISRKVLKH